MSRAIIVIPCYNEAERFNVHTFVEYARAGHPHRFLFINDGSTDRTLQLLEGLCSSDLQRFGVYHLPQNVGKAEAVRQGLLHAFKAEPDYVGYWDADLATPLAAIDTFCELLDSRPNLEAVFGARVRLLGRSIARSTPRHYLGRVFATAASLALGLGIYDTQCGAKLFRSSPEIQWLFQEPFATRWLFDVEILARLIQDRRGTELPQAEDVIYEFPLHEWHDIGGSKVKATDFIKGLFGLAVIYRKYLLLRR